MAYFLPINSTSLAHYFACACVKPARYFENKPQDIQDILQDVLLLSTKLGGKSIDCCLELVLTKEEEEILQWCGNDVCLFPMPLPISRVKKIYFRDKRQLNNTLSNINLSAAFVPSTLAEVTRFSSAQLNTDNILNGTKANDYLPQLESFDRILGALALTKTAKESYMNYSENYASTLSFFNARVSEELHNQGCKINDKFFDLFTRSGKLIKAIPYLERRLTKEDIMEIAAENKQTIERSFSGLITFEKLSGMTYAFAILQSYGVGGEATLKKIDSLISNNFQDLKEGTEEGIALYYGYNRGYSVFSNSYGTSEDNKQVVKFLLDSQLDYYTIESVYQYVFYSNNSSSNFPYLDDWCPKKYQNPKRKTDYKVLDTVFIGKKKPSVFSKEYLQSFLADLKTFDFLNSSLAVLVDHVRTRVATDTKEEVEYDAETKLEEVNAKWAAKFARGNAELQAINAELEAQCNMCAELKMMCEDLAKENELLKAQVSELSSVNEVAEEIQQNPEVESTVKGSDLDQDDLPADDVVVENIVDDDLPEGDLPEEDLPESDHPNDVPQEDTNESESGTDAENADMESTTTDEVTSEGENESQVSEHENVEQTSQEADGTLGLKFE